MGYGKILLAKLGIGHTHGFTKRGVAYENSEPDSTYQILVDGLPVDRRYYPNVENEVARIYIRNPGGVNWFWRTKKYLHPRPCIDFHAEVADKWELENPAGENYDTSAWVFYTTTKDYSGYSKYNHLTYRESFRAGGTYIFGPEYISDNRWRDNTPVMTPNAREYVAFKCGKKKLTEIAKIIQQG